jgi:hypothetical protein
MVIALNWLHTTAVWQNGGLVHNSKFFSNFKIGF